MVELWLNWVRLTLVKDRMGRLSGQDVWLEEGREGRDEGYVR